jgi:hypothetical protein
MRYDPTYDWATKDPMTRTNHYETELFYMRDDCDMIIDSDGNLCIIHGKYKFPYIKVDKEGVIHLANVPRLWLNKNLREILIVFCRAYLNILITMTNIRGYPGIYIRTSSDNYMLGDVRTFMLEDELIQEITISPDLKVTGVREPKKRDKYATTSEW